VLTGDPGTDQQTLTAAGYLGGKIVALKVPAVNTSLEAVIVPADTDTAAALVPFGVLLNGPGEFAGAIGPSGSKKAPIVRALFQGNVNSESYDTVNSPTFVIGKYIYCGGTTHSNIGLYTDTTNKGTLSGNPAVGICTHVPSAAEPWLGVASLL
jgi:hypothetical protein